MKNNPLGPRPAPEADPDDLGAAGLVLAAIRGAAHPLRVGEIARAVGSHDNTVRGHLTTLLRLDLVESETAPAQGRGRPAVLYSAGPRPGVRTDEFRSLAGAFAADLV
ncbi:MAG: helix-turn-helix domain-containing protein, partial [Janibacter sp.]|nr:helix-turn-helix domain-containing protein [Janibacter sp.]